MSSYLDLIERVDSVLHGYTDNVEPTSWLTSPASSTTTTLSITSGLMSL
jgi:hypothetical protein